MDIRLWCGLMMAQSLADFVSKLWLALKDSVETEYSINLLRDSRDLTEKEAESPPRDGLGSSDC
jgi:hypothetical protein